jgi:hypothetical protein
MVLAVGYAALFWWAFRTLPNEDWQFVASVPTHRDNQGAWSGLNLTYYGLFTASAVTLSVGGVIILLGSTEQPLAAIAWLVVTLLALTMPAARVIARIVEGKNNTFTIAGASFAGLLAAPWLILLLNATLGSRLGFALPLFESLGALAIAYAFGEGTGRLACMSFGCCYGRPLPRGMTWWTKLLGARCVTFSGETKKVAYEAGLERVPLVPIQAMTAMFDVGAGLLGLTLFLDGRAPAAFLVTTLFTQLWRVGAEILRADYRGRGAISAYQIMAAVACLYATTLFILLPVEWKGAVHIVAGVQMLWHPGVIVWLQAVWGVTFLYTGCSRVTAARISFLVLRDQI